MAALPPNFYVRGAFPRIAPHHRSIFFALQREELVEERPFRAVKKGLNKMMRFSAGRTFLPAQTPAERLSPSHAGDGSSPIPGNAEE